MEKRREISTLFGVIVIVVVAVVLLGGVIAYQNFMMQQVLNLLVKSCS